MENDNITDCSKCLGNCCYEQQVNLDIKIEWCMGCGFQSNTLLKVGSDFFKEQMEVLPEISKALMVEEEDTGKVWMPSFINVEDKGMVFAKGLSPQLWKWAAVKTVKTTKEEKERLGGAKWKADYTTLKEFDEKEYIDALEYIGLLAGDLM